jgi:SOS response regulatory protein OraA/RecX
VPRKSRASAADASGPTPDAYTLALQWLSVRELSARQLRQRLARRGAPAEAIADALVRLRAAGILDEARMARAAARVETAIKGRGPSRARQKLRALGLAERDVDQAIDAAYREVDVTALLDRALEKRLRRERGDLRDPATVRRVVGSLVRQGFAPAAVLARLRRREASVDEPD